MPVTCVTTTTNRYFVDQSSRLTKIINGFEVNQSIAFFRLVSDFCCILRMQRQGSEFSLTARSSQEKRTSQSGKNIFQEVSSFLKWRHAFVFCYSAPFWILLTALLMATSHVNEAVSKIRREPFIREVRVLCKARLIFSRIKGPIVHFWT